MKLVIISHNFQTETQSQANAAARKVKVNVSTIHPPVLSIEESIAQNKQYEFGVKEFVLGTPDGKYFAEILAD